MSSFKNFKSSFVRAGIKVICTLFLTSCLSPIDISTEKIGGRLVVSGQISTVQDQNIIQLGLTADTERLPFPLSGAFIQLLDDVGGSYPYEEDPLTQGFYYLNNFTGIPGVTYHIQIALPSGEVYESRPEKMPESVGQLSTHFDFLQEEYTDLEGTVSKKYFVKIYSNSTLPTSAEPIYLRWSIEETFLLSPTDFPDPFGNTPPPCFIVQNADPQRIVLFNGEELKTTSFENLLVGSRVIDWSFLERHYFTTYQYSITKEAFDYWSKVNILTSQVGSIFDTPPAEIIGNIYNVNDPTEKVMGFFQASNQVFDRFYLLPSDLPIPLLYTPCTYDPNIFEYPRRCLDCLSVRNSSYNRPDWF